MRRWIPLSFLSLPFLFTAPTTRAVDPPAEAWKLVWADEFAADADGLPDPKKWGYEEGFVRNHEPQYYTANRPENARVEHGLLVIEGRKETFPNPHYDPAATGKSAQPKEAQYTSASLTTQGRADWQYGRFVCCAKVPDGHGCWPAFWMLGSNHKTAGWPACGEVDTMEWFSQHPTKVKGSVLFINSHGKFQSVSKEYAPTPAPADGFHTYECRWSPDRIDLYVDDVKYNTMRVDDAAPGDRNAFRKPMYLLLNLALGSSSGKIDDAKLPARYEVKYVRVYQLAGTR
jgi:beta-glucanase (GH16 family)